MRKIYLTEELPNQYISGRRSPETYFIKGQTSMFVLYPHAVEEILATLLVCGCNFKPESITNWARVATPEGVTLVVFNDVCTTIDIRDTNRFLEKVYENLP